MMEGNRRFVVCLELYLVLGIGNLLNGSLYKHSVFCTDMSKIGCDIAVIGGDVDYIILYPLYIKLTYPGNEGNL